MLCVIPVQGLFAGRMLFRYLKNLVIYFLFLVLVFSIDFIIPKYNFLEQIFPLVSLSNIRLFSNIRYGWHFEFQN